jgi:hypothetical protein
MFGFGKDKPATNPARVFDFAIDAAIANAREAKVSESHLADYLAKKTAGIQLRLDAIVTRRQGPSPVMHSGNKAPLFNWTEAIANAIHGKA